MANVAYSNQYGLSTDGRAYVPVRAPQNQRQGDSIWINATVLVPAGSIVGDTVTIAPVVAGIRPVRAWFTNPQANAALTVDIGYSALQTALDPTKAISALNVFTTTATTVSLTDTQLSAISILPVAQDNLILTIRGATVTTAATWKLFIEFVNSGI